MDSIGGISIQNERIHALRVHKPMAPKLRHRLFLHNYTAYSYNGRLKPRPNTSKPYT